MGSPMNPCRPWKLWAEPMGRDPCRLSRALLLLLPLWRALLLLLPLWRGHSERRGLV